MIAFVDTKIVSTRVDHGHFATSIQVKGKESKRRFRMVEEKRRIVEETLVPGASVGAPRLRQSNPSRR